MEAMEREEEERERAYLERKAEERQTAALREETDDERLEREIAEMEAEELEREEWQRAYQERKATRREAAFEAHQYSAALYVGELDPSVTEAMLFALFSSIGQIDSIRVSRDAITRRSLGFAYVNYTSAADGDRALKELNHTFIKDKPCRIMWARGANFAHDRSRLHLHTPAPPRN